MDHSSDKGDLTLFSVMVLGLVGRQGAGAHDLRRMARQGRVLDWAGESQYYVEPKRLERLGYLEARREPGRTRERTVYALTDKGLAALRAWAPTPSRFPSLKHEPLVHLLIADLVGDEATATSVAALRDDIADLRARLDIAEAMADSLPHRQRYLMLAYGLVRRLLDVHLEWAGEVERELSRGRT
jgi:DNA-binding PadR family transcriptional regulator